MSIFSIWSESNTAAAKAHRATFNVDSFDDAIKYANVWQPYQVPWLFPRGLAEQAADADDTVPQMRNLALAARVEVGDSSEYQIQGRTLSVHDVFASLRNAVPGSAVQFEVQNGRQRACHRVRGVCRAYSDALRYAFSAPSIVDWSPFVDTVGHACAIKTTHVPLLVFAVPKVTGNITLSGVYMCLRPILNSPQHSTNGQKPISYASPLLPNNFCVFEIGQFSGLSFTSRGRAVVASPEILVEAGLARENLRDTSGTTFNCVFGTQSSSAKYRQAMEFLFAPESVDHSLCGTLSADVPNAVSQFLLTPGLWGFPNVFGASCEFGVRGFNAGQCPAFKKRFLDFGKTHEVPFFAGAPANAIMANPEWRQWPHSQLPYTLHNTAFFTIDESLVPAGDVDLPRRPNTPVYELRRFTSEPSLHWRIPPNSIPHPGASVVDFFESYPSRVVDGHASTNAGLAVGSRYDEASFTLGKPRRHGNMVFNDKQIKSVTLSFVPYTRGFSELDPVPRAQLVPNQVSSPQQPSPTITPTSQIFGAAPVSGSAFGPEDCLVPSVFGFEWWNHRNTTQEPANRDPFVGFVRSVVQVDGDYVFSDFAINGRASSIQRTTLPAGSVSLAAEQTAQIYNAVELFGAFSKGLQSSLLPRFSIAGGTDNWIFGRTGGAAWPFLAGGPLTGTYTLNRFQLGDVPTAGNLFKFAGQGEWSASETVSYNNLALVVSHENEYELLPPAFNNPITGKATYKYEGTATSQYVPVPISESWELRTDYVELYLEIGAALQEAGEFAPYPATDPGDGSIEDESAWLLQNHQKPDDPRGKVVDTAVHADGLGPSPVLQVRLHYRTAMRGSVSVSVDTSQLPSYPHSITNQSSQIVANSVRGLAGVGNESGNNQTVEAHHPYGQVSFTLNKQQTAQLMSGQEVMLTNWQDLVGVPVLADTGSVFKHAIKIQLDVSEA